MGFALLGRKRKKFAERIRIDSKLASCAVILAYPGEELGDLSNRLRELGRDGYDVGHEFSLFSSKGPESYSIHLRGWLSILENLGYVRDSINAPFLNEHGVAFFERVIFKRLDRDFEANLKFLEDVGLDVDPYLDRYIETPSEN